jgi:hypothetical protein
MPRTRRLAHQIMLSCAVLATGPAFAQTVQSPASPAPVVQAPGPAPTTPAPTPPAPAAHQLPAAISVLGADVRDQEGHTVGRIIDVLVTPDGHPRAAVVDFGGFMGVGARRVAVDWAELRFTPAGGGPALLELTPDQLRAAPDYKDSNGPVSVVGTPHPLATAPDTTAPDAAPVAAPPAARTAAPSMPSVITPASPPPAASH